MAFHIHPRGETGKIPTSQNPNDLKFTDGLQKKPTSQIWIRKESSDLQLRHLVAAHTTAAGHRDQ